MGMQQGMPHPMQLQNHLQMQNLQNLQNTQQQMQMQNPGGGQQPPQIMNPMINLPPQMINPMQNLNMQGPLPNQIINPIMAPNQMMNPMGNQMAAMMHMQPGMLGGGGPQPTQMPNPPQQPQPIQMPGISSISPPLANLPAGMQQMVTAAPVFGAQPLPLPKMPDDNNPTSVLPSYAGFNFSNSSTTTGGGRPVVHIKPPGVAVDVPWGWN
jgi:hypothetical protein